MRLILFFAACLLLAACSAENDMRPDRSVAVIAEPVGFLPEEAVVEAIGTARAAQTAELYPEAAGEVVAVRFAPGDYVRAGAPLVELEARAERLALKLAEVRVEEAEQLLARYRRIEDTGALSESQIEAGETALAAARIERDQAADALAERTVRAPFSGHIGFTEVDVGDRITPTTLIAQLDRRDRLFVEFNAPEAVFQRLGEGTSVELVPFSEPERTITAPIRARDTAIQQDQRSYRLRAVIANEGDRYRPGMSFTVRYTDRGRMRAAVPEAAVVWGGEGSSVFAVRDGKAVRVPVTIAARRDGLALVDAELEEGALVIAEGVQKVREGQAVELVEPREREAAEVEAAAG
ncbi:efflux RND transporter periplasmic adaptor subunit [Erythrobacter sp.]|uniref:efflux RND transporter periplasmic adaptor subunit n=1 Tax=Erythrobacter sp. TaxID=1042 RepID=UPI001425ECD0|nr:efflux RND transporter periplasmic adaptor subunit [Erythrobacter sp.]QIQ87977.1 MAG: efflux RND transporter periplasmic adaptor subunit [Erythrobacter sp.]